MHREPAPPRRPWWVWETAGRPRGRHATRATPRRPRPLFRLASFWSPPGRGKFPPTGDQVQIEAGPRQQLCEEPDDPEHVRARDDAHGPRPSSAAVWPAEAPAPRCPWGEAGRASEKPMSYARTALDQRRLATSDRATRIAGASPAQASFHGGGPAAFP